MSILLWWLGKEDLWLVAGVAGIDLFIVYNIVELSGKLGGA